MYAKSIIFFMQNTVNFDNKIIYTRYADKIFDKRFNSPNILRRYVHRTQYFSIVKQIQPHEVVIDIGCGEGVLSCLLAQKGIKVVGVDISEPNIKAAKELAIRMGVSDKVDFFIGDAENVPFPDNSFDVALSCHVLEHLPDFKKGLREVYRLTKNKAIVALPTVFNLCSIIQVGHGCYFNKTPRSLLALFIGLFKLIVNLNKEGVNEGYAGNPNLIHIFRYPWIMKRQLLEVGFKIEHFEASSLCLPFFSTLLPLGILLDKFKNKPILRNFGYGSIAVLSKK